ncbi:hypothetical protein DK389_25840 [Methylobacterium durans]|uniref:Uncharacterized protein n=1 Tax=Methylobacterium durans TaxID=2202825 RepID=A0A2U8WB78_9HYPH|nr:hypothetical protein DK389_25840 [Methylobacterium durans]
MLDIVLRLVISGAIMVGTVYLPALTSAHPDARATETASMSEPARSCPAPRASIIPTCVA